VPRTVGMSDALDRRDRLAKYSGERGSMVLVTEGRQAVGALQCEVCNGKHPGGIARGFVLDEPGADVPWVLWMLADDWSLAEHKSRFPGHQLRPAPQDDAVRGLSANPIGLSRIQVVTFTFQSIR